MPSLEQAKSILFRLPREVRDEVYHRYLEAETAVARGNGCYWCSASDDIAVLMVPVQHPLPGLMTACKMTYGELAPHVLGTASVTVFDRGFYGCRTALGVFGNFSISNLRRVVLDPGPCSARWDQWLHFFECLVASDSGARGFIFNEIVEKHYCMDPIPGATQLEELVVVWGSIYRPDRKYYEEVVGGSWVRRDKEDSKEFNERTFALLYVEVEAKWLRTVAAMKYLQTIRLRKHYPKWWADWFREHTKARIICD